MCVLATFPQLKIDSFFSHDSCQNIVMFASEYFYLTFILNHLVSLQ